MPVFETRINSRSYNPAQPRFSTQGGASSRQTPMPRLTRSSYMPTSSRAETRTMPQTAEALMIRGFDVTVAAAAIVALLPLMLLIALFVRMTSAGPVVFRQQRVGRDGVMFPCLKFRSMVIDAQAQLDRLLAHSEEARLEWDRDQKLRRDPRITPIGDFLRKTSLDELPQLFNILVGQMSIVGPRPIVENEIVRYGSRFGHYCSVRPGLTGLWQISGRNDVSYAMRVRLDSLYAQRRSLGLNVAICFKTVPAILSSRGCY